MTIETEEEQRLIELFGTSNIKECYQQLRYNRKGLKKMLKLAGQRKSLNKNQQLQPK